MKVAPLEDVGGQYFSYRWVDALVKDSLPRAWISSSVMKNAKHIAERMQDGKWFDGVILHEFAHGYHINFLGSDYAPVKKAFDNAKAKYATAWNKAYCITWCKGEAATFKANGEICPAPGCAQKPYCMTNEFEYFAELSVAYFKVH
jgi:hypothetical protein